MKYFSVLLAVIAGSAFVSAAPSQANALNARDCPSGYQACGTCTGNSCSIPGFGTDTCKSGSCSSDGNFCGVKNHAVEIECT